MHGTVLGWRLSFLKRFGGFLCRATVKIFIRENVWGRLKRTARAVQAQSVRNYLGV